MPLDIAMQATKTPTNVDNTNYLLCVRSCHSYCIFNHIAETQSTVPYILSFVFHNSGSLSPVELSISRHCPYYRLLWSDYDFIFIHHHVDEPE
jgi:hypothetical protein